MPAKGFQFLSPIFVCQRFQLGHGRLPVVVVVVVAVDRVEEVYVGRPPLQLLHQVVQRVGGQPVLTLKLKKSQARRVAWNN